MIIDEIPTIAPIIVLKRNTLQERDTLKKLDINNPIAGNQIVYKQKYNKRNRYIDIRAN